MLFKDNLEALAFWNRISKGDIDAETLEKLKDVAYEISHAAFYDDYDNAARRAEATLQAVGRNGRMEKYPGLKNLAVNVLHDTSPADLANVADLLLRDFPEGTDPKIVAKSVNAYRFRK